MATTAKHVCKYLMLIFTFLLFFLNILIIRTVLLPPPKTGSVPCQPMDDDYIHLTAEIQQRFIDAIRFKTISYEHGKNINSTRQELEAFISYITKAFPRLHSSPLVRRELINGYSLLYTITGSAAHLRPYMLAAHLDVVPTEGQAWTVPAFTGHIQDGYIYGRGTIDDKHSLMGILESVEYLLSRGFTPRRTLYLAFGHDEELHGNEGAGHIASALRARGLTEGSLEYVLDEGLTLTDGVVKMVKEPVALIGESEKGYLSVNLSVTTPPGHSSMPPVTTGNIFTGRQSHTAIAILANAISRLEANPHPNMFGYSVEYKLFQTLAHYTWFPVRVVLSNLWLFWPLLSHYLTHSPVTNALVRTTTSVTMVGGGVKSNVLPSAAWAVINHRIHPAHSVQQALSHDRAAVGDPRIEMRVLSAREPQPASPHTLCQGTGAATGDQQNHCAHSFGYNNIRKSVLQIFPHAIVAPGTMIANTDTIWYSNFTDSMYRFTPVYNYEGDIGRYHGVDERISLTNYGQLINFYLHVIVNSDVERFRADTVTPRERLAEL